MKALDKIHDIYGGVVSVNMGPSKKIVVIGDYQLLKEAFKDDKGNGRPLDFMWLNEEFRHGDGTDSRGILFSVVSNVFDSIPPWAKLCNQAPSLSLSRWRTLTLLKI